MGADFRLRPEFVYGEEGEHAVAGALMRRGLVVHPVYQYENHDSPPMLYTIDGGFTLPDLMCFGGQSPCMFAEVKRKNQWVRWDGRRETGFNDRLYRKYLKVQELTGLPVWVFFVHDKMEPTGVFAAKLDDLAVTYRLWDGTDRAGRRVTDPMALFDASVLRHVWSLGDVGLDVSRAA
jgi:hypothetical protein